MTRIAIVLLLLERLGFSSAGVTEAAASWTQNQVLDDSPLWVSKEAGSVAGAALHQSEPWW